MNIEQTIALEAKKEARGTTQLGMRLYNERLLLSLIRRHGALPKADLARLTGLSAQTVSVIVRYMESEGLVIKGKPQRGKVGQPLVPFTLNPDGAYSIGLKVGRRSGDLLLIDLAGRERGHVHQAYHFPTPKKILNYAKSGINELLKPLSPNARRRIAGLGVAAPSELWNWGEELGVQRTALEAWRGFDLTAQLAKLFQFPVFPCNDATAACAAELLFGANRGIADFAYFYVGYFVGGGLVLNGTLVQGRTGNAAAFGSIPVPTAAGAAEQLIRSASLYTLESAVARSGQPPNFMWDEADDWSPIAAQIEGWLPKAAFGLAHAMIAVAAITECSDIVLDGAMPTMVRKRLVEAVSRALVQINESGITQFALHEGVIGRKARALGAASLPLFANFITDRDVLFKDTV